MEIIKINNDIYKITIPYKDIFTTVCVVKTPEGVLIFDAASYDEDADNYIIPMLNELKISTNDVKYIFISHNHKDHAGALKRLLEYIPHATVLSRCEELKEKYSRYRVISPDDGDSILNVLKVVTIPGHTKDSMALHDTVTNTLITGDCLQVYGIFGSQDWGSNIRFPVEHIEAVQKVRNLNVSSIYTAHNYHPCGVKAVGSSEVNFLLDSCIEPIEIVKKLVTENPLKSDEELRAIYNSNKDVPPITISIIEAVRSAIEQNKWCYSGKMVIKEITENKKQYLSLLLLADEQEDMIDKYIEKGIMYVLDDNGVKSECVVTDEGNGVIEIKNIATLPEHHGKGYAKALIDFLVKKYAGEYSVLLVGTGDSPLTVPFYEKCGFVRSHTVPNFFIDNYSHPIYECGVQLIDMIYLKKEM